MTPLSRQNRRAAYSLIEVTMAIGVIAVGVIALMGVIPQGLTMMGTADGTATEARISQRIIGELLLSKWEGVDAYNGERRYFDREGIALSSPTRGGAPSNKEQVAFVAAIEVLPPLGSIPAASSGTPGGEAPAGTGASNDKRNLKRVQVHIASVPLIDFKFTDPRRYRTFATVVARMDQ